MDAIRVIIADDHGLFRAGLRALLAAAPGTELVGEAASGEEALELVARLRPAVVLMDLDMPGMGGVEATRRIGQISPRSAVLVITMAEDDQSVFTAMRAGARGYVLKGARHTDLIRAIQTVADGEAIFSPGIAQRMMEYFSAMRTPEAQPVLPLLTEREREVLALIAQGHANAAIAQRLVISAKTVSNHISNIFSKLQVADRAEAIVLARDAGLI